MRTTAQGLKLAIAALNQIPNTRLSGEFTSTYKLLAELDKIERATRRGYVDTLNGLAREFQKWCMDNNLPQLSADEQRNLTPAQAEYIAEFTRRWDEAAGGGS